MTKKTISQTISQTFTFGTLSLLTISSLTVSINANAQINPQKLQENVILEINKNRAQNNLKLLTPNEKFNKTASSYAQIMAQNNHFAHKDLDGQNVDVRMTKNGYNWTTFGENLAAGSDNATFTVDRWMKSVGHKANILNADFCEIGIGYGYSSSSQYKHYWTANFGCREDFNLLTQSKGIEQTKNENMEDSESGENKKIPAIRAHYPYNSTTTLINPSTEKNLQTNTQTLSKLQNVQLIRENKTNVQNIQPTKNSTNSVKVSNFQTCKNAGGELSDFVYNSQTLVKCSISGRHFAILK